MTSPAADIIDFLASTGIDIGIIGLQSGEGWSLNANKEPAQPNNTLTVYNTGGDGQDVDAGFERPSVQLRARSASFEDANTKLQSAIAALTTPLEININSKRYFVSLVDGINSLGTDEKERFILFANLNLYRPTGG